MLTLTIKKLSTLLLNPFSSRRVLKPIKLENLLWNNKPIVEKSVLLWDLENIPFNRLSEIKRVAKYTPQDCYVITKQQLSQKLRQRKGDIEI